MGTPHKLLIGLFIFIGVCGIVGVTYQPTREAEAAKAKDTSKKGECVVPPTWGGVIPGDERFVPTFVDEVGRPRAYCDRQTGAVWEARPEFDEEGITWVEATGFCLNRVVGPDGHKGWRLPSIFELASLIDENSSTCDPPVGPNSICLPDDHPFDNVDSSGYWSATGHAEDPLVAYGVNWKNRVVGLALKTNQLQAWCVRGAMPVDLY